ncbi:hypothetical protein [Kitasatospora terrestris]
MTTPGDKDAPLEDEEAIERSAEERNITSPTPRDVREKADDRADGKDRPEPPAADVRAP